MAGNSEFWAQYRHPNWQKKRMEKLDSAKWKCQECGSSSEQLHVHHIRYVKNRNVWEYGLDELRALCKSCHDSSHETKDSINELFVFANALGINSDVIASLMDGFLDAQSGEAIRVDLYYNNDEWAYISGQIAGLMLSYGFNIYEITELRGEIAQLLLNKHKSREREP